MNDTMTPMSADDPRMIAWTAYQCTVEYKGTLKWALDTNAPGDRRQRYVDGALWAAFVAGFDASQEHDDEAYV